MATAQLAYERSILLENISWETYETLLREAGERHLRMTYDNGDLEITLVRNFSAWVHSKVVPRAGARPPGNGKKS